QIAYFPATHTNISGRHIGIGIYMPGELGHKALAKFHNFVIRFSFWVKIRTALTASHGKCCKAVLKSLLKSQEFKDAEIYRRMETKLSLVWPYCRIHLNSVAFIYLYLAFIIKP